MIDRLSQYPFVIVRLRCHYCVRSGEYRLARLAARFGAEADLDNVLRELSADCAYRSLKARATHGCGVHLPDIGGSPIPPDLPPGLMKLRVVK